MTALRVTPPADEEGADVEGVEEAGRVTCLCPWPFRSKLGLAPSNGSNVYGTHNHKMRRLGIGDRKMVKDPRDSRRKNELITGRRILIHIYKGEGKSMESLSRRDNKN